MAPWRRPAATPPQPQPYAELGLTERGVPADPASCSAAGPTDAELAIYSVMWSEHCSYKSSRVHLRQFAEKAPPSDGAAGRHRAERRRGGHRPGLRGHLQDRVAQPPVLRGAVPGRGDRGGRDRPRHPGHGRPAGGGDGLAAVRPGRRARHRAGCCPAWSAASRSTATASACPTSAASWPSTPATRATRWSTRCAWGSCGTRTSSSPPPAARATRSSCSAPRTGPDGIGGASVLASASFGGGESAKRPSVQVGDPFMEKLLVECCLELYAAGLVAGIQDLGAAGVSCATAELAAGGGSGMRIAPRRRAAARPRARPGRDPHERVAGTHDGRRRRPATWSASWPSAPAGTCRPRSSAR